MKAKPEHDLLLADTPDEYAQQIEKLWSDQSLRAMLARNARSYVESQHDWGAKLAPLVEQIEKHLN